MKKNTNVLSILNLETLSLSKVLVTLLIVLIPVLSTKGTLDPNLSLQHVALSATLLIFTFWGLLKGKTIWLNSKFTKTFLIVFALFLLYSISSILISRNIGDALFFYSNYILGYFIVGLIILFRDAENLFRQAARMATILILIISIPAYFDLFELLKSGDLEFPKSSYQIQSLFEHRNLLAELLLLALPFVVYLFFNEKHTWKWIAAITFGLALLLLIILSNRAAWIGLFVMSLLFAYSLRKIKCKRSKLQFLGIIFGAILVSLFFLKGFSNTASLKQHTVNIVDVNQGSTKDRLELWERTIALIKEKPLFGHGLGTWKINMLKYGNDGLASEDNTSFYQRPHNDYLWIASEQGVVGLLLYLSLTGIVLLALLKSLSRGSKIENKGPLFVCLMITLAFLILSFFSFPKERLSHMIFLYSTWGLLFSLINDVDQKQETSKKRVFTYVVPLGTLMLILMFGGLRYKSEVHTKKAILAKKRSDFTRCIQEIKLAESPFYTIDATSTPLSWYSGLAQYKLNNTESALREFEKAYAINPYHIYTLNDYAGSLSQLGNNEMAKKLYIKATHISSTFLEAKLNLCAIYFKQDSLNNAFEVLKTTDPESLSPRYQKTLTVIIRSLILSSVEPNQDFKPILRKNQNNFYFYKEVLSKAKKYNLRIDEIIEKPSQYLSKPYQP